MTVGCCASSLGPVRSHLVGERPLAYSSSTHALCRYPEAYLRQSISCHVPAKPGADPGRKGGRPLALRCGALNPDLSIRGEANAGGNWPKTRMAGCLRPQLGAKPVENDRGLPAQPVRHSGCAGQGGRNCKRGGRQQTVVGMLTFIGDVHAMGLKTAQGMYVASQYY